jgi:peptidoglycan/xylan/chitin deacetylase (PgdA/CDA1 family)
VLRRQICAAVVLAALLYPVLSACSSASPRPTPTPSGSVTPRSTPSAPAGSPSTPPPKPKPKPTATQVKQTQPKGFGPGGSLLKTGSSAVALTFDDGPDPVNTPKVLDLLKKYGIKATFCVIGTSARSHPDLIRRIVAEGHTLCNHSWIHRLDLATSADAVVLRDLRDTNNAILAAAPKAKIQYFRAPGGNFTTHLVQLAASLGMRSLYWSVDPKDWDTKTFGHGSAMVNHIIGVVTTRTRPGAIILSHDGHKPDTPVAYRTLLPWLKAHYKLIAMPVR